jgi:hypothetical protein
MIMIDVAELITDPDFAQNYTVYRRTYDWLNGRYNIIDTQILNYFGAVQPAEPKMLEQITEADRTSAVLNFYCASPKVFYLSEKSGGDNSDDDKIIYDKILFKGVYYKIIKVLDWSDNGCQIAFGVETHGGDN